MPFSYNWMRAENSLTELLAGRVRLHTASSLIFFIARSPWQRMIHKMKYNSQKRIAYALGEIYGYQLLSSRLYDGIDTIIPVPLHPFRQLSRGYNQSEHFAKGIASQLGAKVMTGVLRRSRHTKRQALKPAGEDRWQNVREAFRVRGAGRLEGLRIMLVDDVITSGSTIEACAQALHRASPELRIWVGSIAFVNKKHPKSQ